MFPILEPIGGVAPKVNSYAKFDELTVKQGFTSCLLCPAQSYPVALFR